MVNKKTNKPRKLKINSEIEINSQSLSVPGVSATEKIEPQTRKEDNELRKIQELVNLAQAEYTNTRNKIIKEKKREIGALDTQIKEFMGAFMLIGYDLNNNPVEMVSTTSVAEQDALLERLRRVMYRINQNIANSNGTDPYGLNNTS